MMLSLPSPFCEKEMIAFILFLIICMCVFVHVKLVTTVFRGRDQIPWDWSYRQLWANQCGCWELYVGHLGVQYKLLWLSHILKIFKFISLHIYYLHIYLLLPGRIHITGLTIIFTLNFYSFYKWWENLLVKYFLQTQKK